MRPLELQNLILIKEPPEKRLAKANGGKEHHMSEAAVMLAFAIHLFSRGALKVSVHPDGEHGKRFEIQAWLAAHGFTWQEGWGTTSYAGRYMSGDLILEVHVSPARVTSLPLSEIKPLSLNAKAALSTHGTPGRSLACGRDCTRPPANCSRSQEKVRSTSRWCRALTQRAISQLRWHLEQIEPAFPLRSFRRPEQWSISAPTP